MNSNNDGINVLSLFDGISCGQIALERAGVKVNNYFASEIDSNAIKVTQHNYPNTIQLGDVTKIDLNQLPKIDLLQAGSPCQGFSFAGKQLNFDDPRSKLFFTFSEILNFLKGENPNIKFLLENVKMKKEYQNVITDTVGVSPILIDSALFSAQMRKRLYWTNIKIEDGGDYNNTKFQDILDSGYVDREKSFCIVCQSTWIGRENMALEKVAYRNKKGFLPIVYKDQNFNLKDGWRCLNLNEIERLQTLPDDYTGVLTRNSPRYKAIGNGWTVDVIAHFYKSLIN